MCSAFKLSFVFASLLVGQSPATHPSGERPAGKVVADESARAAMLSVRAAAVANETRYAKGRIVVEFRRKSDFDPAEARVELIWDGDDRRWRYDYRTAGYTSADGNLSRWFRGNDRIETSSARVRYTGSENSMTIWRGAAKSTLPGFLQVRPSESWFVLGQHFSVADIVNFECKDCVDRLEVRDGGQTLIADRTAEFGKRSTLTFDLSRGCRILEYQSHPATEELPKWFSPNTCRQRWTWSDDADPVLRETEFEQWAPGSDDPVVTETLKVLEFDPDYEIPPGTFSFSNLNVKRGTEVVTYSPEPRIWIYGGDLPQAQKEQRDIDQMIERVRDRAGD